MPLYLVRRTGIYPRLSSNLVHCIVLYLCWRDRKEGEGGGRGWENKKGEVVYLSNLGPINHLLNLIKLLDSHLLTSNMLRIECRRSCCSDCCCCCFFCGMCFLFCIFALLLLFLQQNIQNVSLRIWILLASILNCQLSLMMVK